MGRLNIIFYFSYWVFDTVLPEIRHNGGYISNAEELIAKTATAVVTEVMKQIIPIISAQATPTSITGAELDLSKYRRKSQPCVIEELDKGLRAQVDEMLRCGEYSQKGIAEFLNENGVKISQMAVCRYAQTRLGITRRTRTVSLQISLDEIKGD